MLVERQVLAAELLLVADDGSSSGRRWTSTPVSRASRSAFAGCGAEQQLRQLPHPVRGEPAADPLGRDVRDPRRPLAHLAQRVLVGLEAELRDEAEAADDPQRVVAEARRARRAQDTPLEVVAPAERVEQLSGLEPPRDRVDR